MCIRSTTCRITCSGHGEPAMIPVRRLDRSNCPGSEWSSSANSAMNMVGTPYKLVQRYSATARNAASGSNVGDGMTIAAP